MRRYLLCLILLLPASVSFSQTVYQKDFQFYLETVNDNFAYFDKQQIDWGKVKQIYQHSADTITNRSSFVHLLETVDNELYNGHVFLNTNTSSSSRSVPSGSDIKAAYDGKKFVITEIREGYNADICGLKPGMTIVKVNDIAIEKAVAEFLPKSVNTFNPRMYEYAVNTLLAGRHNTKRKITVMLNGAEKTFEPDAIPNKTETNPEKLLETRHLGSNTGYIRINNSLGNTDLIKAFDAALDSLMNTDALVLDLRETPSGGNTTVARAIMGRFIKTDMPYQKHIYTGEEKETGIKRSTLELVSPRLTIYNNSLIILVGNWTGSMGEGIAIGFDGMKRAKIAGTKMAGLLGEIYTFNTPGLNIPFSIPFAQLQHVNGQPREDFVPPYPVSDQKEAVKFALNLLNK